MMNISYKMLLLLALGMTTTEAFPKGRQMAKCHLKKYRALPPEDLKAFKKAKDKFHDMVLLSDEKCNTNIFNRDWTVKELSVHDRVILVKKELDFTIDLLEDVEDSSLSDLLSTPLEILKHIREDLRVCIREKHFHQQDERLKTWLQDFNASKKKETPGCLEASVIFYFFRLLNEDLRCAAYMEHC